MTEAEESPIPGSVLERLSRLRADQSVALLLRHSARGPLPPGQPGDHVPLTEHGRGLAISLGERLRGRLRSLHTSPVLRCVQTAEALREGAGAGREISLDFLLGNPGVYVRDGRLAWSNWQRLGHEGVIQHLMSAKDPLPGMHRPDVAARALVDHMLAMAAKAAGIHIFVTHDSLVTVTVARFLKRNLELCEWPTYLEGAFFYREAAELHMAYRDIDVRLPS